MLKATLILFIFLFSGCSDKMPSPTFVKSKFPKMETLPKIPKQYLKVTKIGNGNCKVKCKDLIEMSKLSIKRLEVTNYYEYVLKEFNKEFTK